MMKVLNQKNTQLCNDKTSGVIVSMWDFTWTFGHIFAEASFFRLLFPTVESSYCFSKLPDLWSKPQTGNCGSERHCLCCFRCCLDVSLNTV